MSPRYSPDAFSGASDRTATPQVAPRTTQPFAAISPLATEEQVGRPHSEGRAGRFTMIGIAVIAGLAAGGLTLRRRARCARPEVPIAVLRGRVMVALAMGQSNAANSGESPIRAGRGVYNFHEGKLYIARDPLLGGSNNGGGGSVWTRLGPKLLKHLRRGRVRVGGGGGRIDSSMGTWHRAPQPRPKNVGVLASLWARTHARPVASGRE
jgi:hypothetical protein